MRTISFLLCVGLVIIPTGCKHARSQHSDTSEVGLRDTTQDETRVVCAENGYVVMKQCSNDVLFANANCSNRLCSVLTTSIPEDNFYEKIGNLDTGNRPKTEKGLEKLNEDIASNPHNKAELERWRDNLILSLKMKKDMRDKIEAPNQAAQFWQGKKDDPNYDIVYSIFKGLEIDELDRNRAKNDAAQRSSACYDRCDIALTNCIRSCLTSTVIESCKSQCGASQSSCIRACD